MRVIEVATTVAAPPERVFDAARDITLHEGSMRRYAERAVGGVTSGRIGPGEEVTWRARHLGRTWSLTSRITAFDPPSHFRDSMVAGPFRAFEHDHYFDRDGDGTTMRDVFAYDVPYGLLGAAADALVLRRHLRRLLEERASAVKTAAESSS